MKLWKILLATMIALVLVCAVAMADECTHPAASKVIDTPNKVVDKCQGLIITPTYCGNCGGNKGYDIVNTAVEHEFGTTFTVAATCGKDKYDAHTCKVCNTTEKVKTYEGTALTHNYTWVWTKDPTCTEKGYQKLTCGNCGDVSQEAEIATTAHDWAVNTLVPATCTEDGKANYKCKDCGKEENEHKLNKLNHKNVETIAVTAATCASWGHEVTAYNKCKDCGEITYTAKKNAYNVGVDEKANGCGVEGHSAYLYCSICEATKDKVIYPAMTHNYAVELENLYIAPTCELPGQRGFICKNQNVFHQYCNDTMTIELPKVGHQKSNDWRVIEAPTCNEPGLEEILCMWCWAVAEYREIPALGHNFFSAAAIMKDYSKAYRHEKPECEADGWAYAKCANGCVSDKYVVLPATGHTMSSWVVEDYDCVLGSVGTRACEVCGEDEEKVFVPAAGHKWEITGGKKPTCVSDGAVDRTCSVCSTTQTKVYMPATGHQNYEVIAETKPECGKAGSITKKCDDCGMTVTEAVAALAHKYEWKTTPATPSANGKSEYICGLCGDVAETKTIKYTKWYYNNTMTSFGPTTKELVGGNDWYRVTPVDLAVDGVYTYDLVASNKYVVGTVTISVNAGTLSVSYKAQHGVEIKDEALLIYASKADLAAGSAVTAAVGSAINTAETFGEDTKVLVSLVLTGNYDAAGKSYVDADAASALAANID